LEKYSKMGKLHSNMGSKVPQNLQNTCNFFKRELQELCKCSKACEIYTWQPESQNQVSLIPAGIYLIIVAIPEIQIQLILRANTLAQSCFLSKLVRESPFPVQVQENTMLITERSPVGENCKPPPALFQSVCS
jgi:hypothetical protein